MALPAPVRVLVVGTIIESTSSRVDCYQVQLDEKFEKSTPCQQGYTKCVTKSPEGLQLLYDPDVKLNKL